MNVLGLLSVSQVETFGINHFVGDGLPVARLLGETRVGRFHIDLHGLLAERVEAACIGFLAKRGWMFIPEHKVAVEARGQSPAAVADHVELHDARADARSARVRMVATAAAAADAERAYVKAIAAAAALPDDVSLARATDPDA